MTDRDLHISERNAARIELATRELAAEHQLPEDDIRRRIHALVAPYPPTAQCLEAIAKVRLQLKSAIHRSAE